MTRTLAFGMRQGQMQICQSKPIRDFLFKRTTMHLRSRKKTDVRLRRVILFVGTALFWCYNNRGIEYNTNLVMMMIQCKVRYNTMQHNERYHCRI